MVAKIADDEIIVSIFVESRYKVNRSRIKKTATNVIRQSGVQGGAEVSVAIVGDRKMRVLHKKYKGEDKTTNVLSFSLVEGSSVVLPSDDLRLGDIVISYPQVIKEAVLEEKLVDDKIDELIAHGMRHLMGTHHEE